VIERLTGRIVVSGGADKIQGHSKEFGLGIEKGGQPGRLQKVNIQCNVTALSCCWDNLSYFWGYKSIYTPSAYTSQEFCRLIKWKFMA